jgi:UDP-GlcNAc3NAcA epimerase
VSRAILAHNHASGSPVIEEQIIHTGQHYDSNMSDVFFKELQIPEPAVNLQAGTGGHGEMTGRMLIQLEQEMVQRKPDWVLVYGDTNSTLAGALAAAKLHIPVAHVEAGLRSFNKRMPEEVNRILTDHVATQLFCPTQTSIGNLAREGITEQVHHVGDVMYDAALLFGELAMRTSDVLDRLGLKPRAFSLATVHRAENTDDPVRLQAILEGLQAVEGIVVLPLHPRTRGKLPEGFLAKGRSNLLITDPLPYLDMVMLEKHASLILTDSGGVQKEAYFHSVPCITLRDETEWVETLAAGWNQLAGAERDQIAACVARARSGQAIPDYGNGHSASSIVSLLTAPSVSGFGCRQGTEVAT